MQRERKEKEGTRGMARGPKKRGNINKVKNNIVPISEEVKQILEPIIKKDQIHSNIEGNSLHISLSRCVFLKEHQLNMFVQKVRNQVTQDAR